MPKRNSKGQYVKGGHHARKSHSRARSTTTAIVVAAPRAAARRSSPRHAVKHTKRRRGHSKSGGGGVKLVHLAVAGAGLAYLTGDNSPIAAIPAAVAKIPGAKTFGNTTAAGLVCLGVDRFVKRNKWLRYAGIVGVIAGALQVGAKGKDLKWLGDAEGGDEFTGDIDLDGDDE